jgi:large subunit ribosomal protein L15
MKGQNARQGNSKRPELRDIIKKIPKLRGQGVHGNRARDLVQNALVVDLSTIDAHFAAGETVNAKTLQQKNLITAPATGQEVKILNNGEITTAVEVRGVKVSASAQAAIEKAGGSVK